MPVINLNISKYEKCNTKRYLNMKGQETCKYKPNTRFYLQIYVYYNQDLK